MSQELNRGLLPINKLPTCVFFILTPLPTGKKSKQGMQDTEVNFIDNIFSMSSRRRREGPPGVLEGTAEPRVNRWVLLPLSSPLALPLPP